MARHPVVTVSHQDAAACCRWLTGRGNHAFSRLSAGEEWILAAGYMPKGAVGRL